MRSRRSAPEALLSDGDGLDVGSHAASATNHVEVGHAVSDELRYGRPVTGELVGLHSAQLGSRPVRPVIETQAGAGRDGQDTVVTAKLGEGAGGVHVRRGDAPVEIESLHRSPTGPDRELRGDAKSVLPAYRLDIGAPDHEVAAFQW